MKLTKLLYIAAILSGCTNVNSDRKLVWKGQRDSCNHNRYIAYPYWYWNRMFIPLNQQERISYSHGESVESISERGGFGSHGTAEHAGGAGE